MSDIPLQEAKALLKLPERLLRQLHRDGIICDPLPQAELRGLAILASMWDDPKYLRLHARQFRADQRRKILKDPDLDRIDRYILKIYLNHTGGYLSVKEVAGKVSRHLKVSASYERIRRVREVAYDIRRGKRQDPF